MATLVTSRFEIDPISGLPTVAVGRVTGGAETIGCAVTLRLRGDGLDEPIADGTMQDVNGTGEFAFALANGVLRTVGDRILPPDRTFWCIYAVLTCESSGGAALSRTNLECRTRQGVAVNATRHEERVTSADVSLCTCFCLLAYETVPNRPRDLAGPPTYVSAAFGLRMEEIVTGWVEYRCEVLRKDYDCFTHDLTLQTRLNVWLQLHGFRIRRSRWRNWIWLGPVPVWPAQTWGPWSAPIREDLPRLSHWDSFSRVNPPLTPVCTGVGRRCEPE